MSVRYEVSDGLAVITLDRPDVLNAFNDELGNAALERVLEASADPEVRCIVITGAGRAFSSGEDLAALADGYRARRGRSARRHPPVPLQPPDPGPPGGSETCGRGGERRSRGGRGQHRARL